MRLISYRLPSAGAGLGVVAGTSWLPAETLLADEIPDPQSLAISCQVAGRTLQQATTADMYFGVAAIISHCSQAFRLEPGDVIATGTPGGVGIFRDRPILLGDGDEVVVEIERIGRLVNTCRFESGAAS